MIQKMKKRFFFAMHYFLIRESRVFCPRFSTEIEGVLRTRAGLPTNQIRGKKLWKLGKPFRIHTRIFFKIRQDSCHENLHV